MVDKDKRAIRFTFIIQNFAQLKSVYGNEDAETIKGNCGNLVYLISTELAALEEISKMCGEVKSKDDEKTASTPLVTVTDLPKGNYPVTEISDWSWRYVCYNVLVQRDNNTVASGNGTIIGVNPIPESKG